MAFCNAKNLLMAKVVEGLRKREDNTGYEPSRSGSEVTRSGCGTDKRILDLTNFVAEKQPLYVKKVLDFTIRMCGHPEQLGAITLTFHYDNCQCIPWRLHVVRMWRSDTLKSQAATLFFGRCGFMQQLEREGSIIVR